MTRQVLKAVAFGLLWGFAIFAFTFFIIKVFLATLIIGFVVRMFFRRQMRHYSHMHYAWASKWQNMNEEERNAHIEKRRAWKAHHMKGGHYCGETTEERSSENDKK